MTANSLLNVTQKDALKLKPMTMFFKKYVLTRFSKFGKRNVAWYVWKKNMRKMFQTMIKLVTGSLRTSVKEGEL